MMSFFTRRWVRVALVGTVAVVLLALGLTFYLVRRPPAVWTEAQEILAQTTPQERAEKADQVIERLSEMVDQNDARVSSGGNTPQGHAETFALSNQTVDDTHELQLSNEELVALASEMFSDWTAQRGYSVPKHITRPVVLADNGRLAIAFEITTHSWRQVYSGYVELTFRPDGMALGRVVDLTAGSLPVSVVSVGETLRKQLPKSESALADQIGDWIAQLEAFEFRPVLEMEHRRRARITSMAVGKEHVTLQMRVQDHVTYKQHNALLGAGAVAVTDSLDGLLPGSGAIADVPTTTD